MMRPLSLVCKFLLAAVLLISSACSDQDSSISRVSKGDQFPPLLLQSLAGDQQNSASLFAGKVVVLNVWATWCPPCRAEMPDLGKLKASLDPAHFAVLGLSTDRSVEQVQEFVTENRVSFPIYWDKGGKYASSIGVRSYPTTYIIDANGKVEDIIIGIYSWADAGLIARLQALQAG